MKRIKNFILEDATPELIESLESVVNDFIGLHNVLDIKVTSCCNSFGYTVLYTVIYDDSENDL